MAQETAWESPSPHAGRKPGAYSFAAQAARLQASPGDWDVIRRYPARQAATARGIGVKVRNGSYPVFRPVGAWESVTRTKGEEVLIFARYIGEHGEFAGKDSDGAGGAVPADRD